MKLLIILSLLCTSLSLSAQRSDAKRDNLKGLVAKVKETTYSFDMKFGEIVKGTAQESLETFYDERGNIYKIKKGRDEDAIYYSYDSQGRLSTIVTVNRYMDTIRQETYTYESNEKLSEVNEYKGYPLLHLTRKDKYKYTSEGTMISIYNGEGELEKQKLIVPKGGGRVEKEATKEIEYDSLGRMVRISEFIIAGNGIAGATAFFKYDENGDLEQINSGQGVSTSTADDRYSVVTRYEYKYDSHRNWTVQTSYRGPEPHSYKEKEYTYASSTEELAIMRKTTLQQDKEDAKLRFEIYQREIANYSRTQDSLQKVQDSLQKIQDSILVEKTRLYNIINKVINENVITENTRFSYRTWYNKWKTQNCSQSIINVSGGECITFTLADNSQIPITFQDSLVSLTHFFSMDSGDNSLYRNYNIAYTKDRNYILLLLKRYTYSSLENEIGLLIQILNNESYTCYSLDENIVIQTKRLLDKDSVRSETIFLYSVIRKLFMDNLKYDNIHLYWNTNNGLQTIKKAIIKDQSINFICKDNTTLPPANLPMNPTKLTEFFDENILAESQIKIPQYMKETDLIYQTEGNEYIIIILEGNDGSLIHFLPNTYQVYNLSENAILSIKTGKTATTGGRLLKKVLNEL